MTEKLGVQGTAHPLHKGTLWVKYELDWVKRRENYHRGSDFGRTDTTNEGCQMHYVT